MPGWTNTYGSRIPSRLCLTEDFECFIPPEEISNDSSRAPASPPGRVFAPCRNRGVFYLDRAQISGEACARLRPSLPGMSLDSHPSAAVTHVHEIASPAQGVTVGPERDPGIHIQESPR